MKRLPAFLVVLFCADFAFGEYITTNVTGGCGDENVLFAIFERNSYTCPTGYYLPANTDGCSTCLSGYVCDGGTFTFNETDNQGIHYSRPFATNVTYGCDDNLVENGILNAIFKPNSHTCTSGYYLPANVDECTICPANSICSGGTYSFNEIADQGIQSCVNGFSPSGSAVCYPHIFHVGNDIMYMKTTKQTTPSFNIQIGNDRFYINMTTTRTRMNKDSEHYFHADWGDNHYYVCDDTTCPNAE